MHHTGSQENEVGPEEQEEAQEKGKPRSILSLLILANINNILCLFYYVHLSDRNCLIPLMHMYSLTSSLMYLPCPM